MKLKIMTLAIFVAGVGASFALANDGHGKGKHEGDHGHKGSKCTHVHVKGSIAPQTLTVTVDRGSRKLNLAPGSQVVLQVGGTDQTVRVSAEACLVTVGSATTLQVKELELKARNTKTTTTTATTATTTTAATTTTGTTTTTP
jgi:hypothetical protein